jgi:hypothetical protein
MSQYGSASPAGRLADTRNRASVGTVPRYVAVTVTVTPPAGVRPAA